MATSVVYLVVGALIICFLTVASVCMKIAGFVAAAFRHFRSLRQLSHDQGWILTLLEEAENGMCTCGVLAKLVCLC